ncbi:MAG: glycosyltransferase family 4 protein [Sterolibacterium sp.]
MSFLAFFLDLVFAAAIVCCSAGLTGWLVRHPLVHDVPNERSSHRVPTPRGGGLAIVAGFLLGILLIHLCGDVVPIRSRYFWGFLASLLLVAAVSLYDDVKTRSPLLKIGTQLIAIAMMMGTGILIDTLHVPWLGLVAAQWWFYPLTLFWLLGLTNAYNFMDGLDGMAAGTAVIASLFFSVIAFQQGSFFIYFAALALCAASLGFLVFNWPPARIFMGDIGSTFLGLAFASLAIVAARDDHAHVSLFVVPLLLFHFLFDTVFTFLRRLLRGENVFQAHRTHLYQLLNRLGYSHGKVSLLYAAMAFAQGLAALWMVNRLVANPFLMYLPFLFLHAMYAACVIKRAKQRGIA